MVTFLNMQSLVVRYIWDKIKASLRMSIFFDSDDVSIRVRWERNSDEWYGIRDVSLEAGTVERAAWEIYAKLFFASVDGSGGVIHQPTGRCAVELGNRGTYMDELELLLIRQHSPQKNGTCVALPPSLDLKMWVIFRKSHYSPPS